MKNKKIIRFVESFILFPVMTMSIPVGNVPNSGLNFVSAPHVVSLTEYIQSDATLAINQVIAEQQHILDMKAAAVDAYFSGHNMPLAGTGMKMVQEAEKNGLDWRLIAAISVRESTGGQHDCVKVNNNPFGWGSCKIGFTSVDEAIETVARNLGGNNPNTAYHYSGKTTKEILQKYNPPSIVPNYAPQVMNIMDDIGDAEIVITPNA